MRLLIAVLTVSTLLLTLPAVGSACINEVQIETNQAVRIVAKADKALQRGKYKRAARLAVRVLDRTSVKVERRARMILALAVIRSGGSVGYKEGKRLPALYGDAGLKDAARQLQRGIDKHGFDEPRWQAGLAEAKAARGDAKGALVILEDLAARDLLPDAHSFAVLARLRAAKGDVAGRDAAAERCRALGGKKAMCAVPGS